MSYIFMLVTGLSPSVDKPTWLIQLTHFLLFLKYTVYDITYSYSYNTVNAVFGHFSLKGQ